MSQNILIFAPNCLDTKKTGYIKGLHTSFSNCDGFYITSHKVFKNYCSECIGFIGKKITSKNIKRPFLHLNNINNNIFINNTLMNSDSVVQIMYDYDGFKNCDIVEFESNYGRHFQIISNALRKTKNNVKNGRNSFCKIFLHMLIYLLRLILWVNYLVLAKLKEYRC